MAAGIYQFTIEQGATLDFEIQYVDSTGTPVDLSGYSGFMQIRSGISSSADSVTYLTFSSSLGDTYIKEAGNSFLSFSGSSLTNPLSSGTIGVYAGYLATQDVEFSGDAYYDLELTFSYEKKRLLEGKVYLSKQVTQDTPTNIEYMLWEDSGYLLLEDDFKIIL